METRPGARALTESECWSALDAAEIGRLAVVIADEPEIFPVNFVVDGQTVLFKTAEGTKLFALTLSPRVAFETDGYDPDSGEAWSVVVKGTAQRLEHFNDIYVAERLPLFPWHAGTKQWFVRIGQATVTGVRFAVARGQRED